MFQLTFSNSVLELTLAVLVLLGSFAFTPENALSFGWITERNNAKNVWFRIGLYLIRIFWIYALRDEIYNIKNLPWGIIWLFCGLNFASMFSMSNPKSYFLIFFTNFVWVLAVPLRLLGGVWTATWTVVALSETPTERKANRLNLSMIDFYKGSNRFHDH